MLAATAAVVTLTCGGIARIAARVFYICAASENSVQPASVAIEVMASAAASVGKHALPCAQGRAMSRRPIAVRAQGAPRWLLVCGGGRRSSGGWRPAAVPAHGLWPPCSCCTATVFGHTAALQGLPTLLNDIHLPASPPPSPSQRHRPSCRRCSRAWRTRMPPPGLRSPSGMWSSRSSSTRRRWTTCSRRVLGRIAPVNGAAAAVNASTCRRSPGAPPLLLLIKAVLTLGAAGGARDGAGAARHR